MTFAAMQATTQNACHRVTRKLYSGTDHVFTTLIYPDFETKSQHPRMCVCIRAEWVDARPIDYVLILGNSLLHDHMTFHDAVEDGMHELLRNSPTASRYVITGVS